MEGLERIVSEHRLFHDLGPEFVNLAAGCAKNARFNADQYLFHADDAADWIYLIRHGSVALEVATPGRGAVQFETLGEGDIVGLTWLLPPTAGAMRTRARPNWSARSPSMRSVCATSARRTTISAMRC